MLKKAIACLLVLAGVCSFHTSAADSKNEQFVNVNVFNKVYYGTVTKNADAGRHQLDDKSACLPVNPLIFFR